MDDVGEILNIETVLENFADIVVHIITKLPRVNETRNNGEITKNPQIDKAMYTIIEKQLNAWVLSSIQRALRYPNAPPIEYDKKKGAWNIARHCMSALKIIATTKKMNDKTTIDNLIDLFEVLCSVKDSDYGYIARQRAVDFIRTLQEFAEYNWDTDNSGKERFDTMTRRLRWTAQSLGRWLNKCAP